MHLAHPVYPAGVIENPFGNGRFSGVNMGNDTDIARPGELLIRWHLFFITKVKFCDCPAVPPFRLHLIQGCRIRVQTENMEELLEKWLLL